MAAQRVPALRNTIIGTKEPCLRGIQRRWAQVHDVRFLATHGQQDRVIEKYKEKLERKAKEYASSWWLPLLSLSFLALANMDIERVSKTSMNSRKSTAAKSNNSKSRLPQHLHHHSHLHLHLLEYNLALNPHHLLRKNLPNSLPASKPSPPTSTSPKPSPFP
jgi:Sec7-like guanine-nucleotide exchange factor